MATQTKRRFLVIRELETGREEHRIEVTGKSESQVDRIEIGLLRKVDPDRFYVDDTALSEPSNV